MHKAEVQAGQQETSTDSYIPKENMNIQYCHMKQCVQMQT